MLQQHAAPTTGFLDVHSHPLIFRRSQSREILDAHRQEQQRQQSVSTFQHRPHHNSTTDNGPLQLAAGVNNQILPLIEVRTLGRPVNKKRGQNSTILSSTTDAIQQQQAKLQAQV